MREHERRPTLEELKTWVYEFTKANRSLHLQCAKGVLEENLKRNIGKQWWGECINFDTLWRSYQKAHVPNQSFLERAKWISEMNQTERFLLSVLVEKIELEHRAGLE